MSYFHCHNNRKAMARARNLPPSRVKGETHVAIAAAGVALVIAVVLIGAFCALFGARPAKAHDAAQWIQDGNYKNAAGELCCGRRDCFELDSSDIKITAAGYFIISIRETVPFNEATPSPDGHYWRCQWGGSRKCFFAPPGST